MLCRSGRICDICPSPFAGFHGCIRCFFQLVTWGIEIWAWKNMDALCKCMFIIIETILNIEHEDLTCFKAH